MTPDDAASMAQYLIDAGLTPDAQREAETKAAVERAESILRRMGYAQNKLKPLAPDPFIGEDADSLAAQAYADAAELGEELVRRMSWRDSLE